MCIFAGYLNEMKVLFVCNNAFHPGNGQSVAVRKMIKALREHGVDARLMAIACSGLPYCAGRNTSQALAMS